MSDGIQRQRQPDPKLVEMIPSFVKRTLPKESVFQLASIIKDYEVMEKPDIGEVAYTGSSRITGYTSGFNIFGSVGYYNSSDIPISTLDTMRRDSQIALGMAIVKYPITNLGFTINCEDSVIRDFVKTNIKPLWSKLLRDTLLSFDYGFSAFEKVWENKKLDIDPGPGKHKLKGGKYIVLSKMKPLYPSTVRIRLDNLNNFAGINQQNFGKEPIKLDRNKCMLYTYQEEYGNYFGKPRLATAYESWYWKIISTQFFLRWMERHSIPPYKVHYPHGITNTANAGQMNNAELALRMAQAVSSYGNITLPSKVDDKGNRLWDINTIDQGKQDLTLKEVVDVWNVGILRGLLIPDEGSLGGLDKDIATEIFLSTLGDSVRQAEELFNKELVKPLIAWNFPREKIVPCTLNIDEIDFHKRQEMRKLLSKIMDISATFLKQKGGLPYNTIPDVSRIFEILGIPGAKSAVYMPPTIGPDGKPVKEEETQKPSENGNTGPDKGEETPGNQSRKNRNGEPRDEDRDDVSNK